MEQKDTIKLTNKMWGKGLILTLYSDDVEKIEKFKFLCMANMPRSTEWFHQSNSSTYQMFEFWRPDLALILIVAGQIARDMDLPMVTEVEDVAPLIRNNQVFTIPDYKKFDEDMHTFGNFYG